MSLVLRPHAVSRKLRPVVEGVYCASCGHEIPATVAAPRTAPIEQYTVATAEGDVIAERHRPDLLYVFGPGQDNLLCCLHSLEGETPNVSVLLNHMLHDLASDAEGQAFLAKFGIGVSAILEDTPVGPTLSAKVDIARLLERPHPFDDPAAPHTKGAPS